MAGLPTRDLSKINIDGNSYNLKDASARATLAEVQETVAALDGSLSSLAGIVKILGKTTTQIVDGSTTKNVLVDGETIEAISGDVVFVEKTIDNVTTCIEFLFDGTKWQELGPTGNLKQLAFKDAASGSYTPEGTVEAPEMSVTPESEEIVETQFEYDENNEQLNITTEQKSVMTGVEVEASAPAFTGTAKNVSVS